MEIGNTSGVQSLWELATIGKVDGSRRYTKIQSETTHSGDTVSISDEAKQLYSEMIHKYDHGAESAAKGNADVQEDAPGVEEASGYAGGTGGSGGLQSSTSSVESIKKQIQALKSQLSALAAQAQNGNAAVTAKMNALESQIAALESQLNETESA